MRASLKSASIIMVARELMISKCSASAFSGAAIMKISLVGLPSRDLKSTPSGTVIAARPGAATESAFAWGVAIPSPRPVDMVSSR